MECPLPSTSVALGLDAGDQLRQRKACFHIPAYSVQQHQQTFDARILLRGHQLRDDMLIL